MQAEAVSPLLTTANNLRRLGAICMHRHWFCDRKYSIYSTFAITAWALNLGFVRVLVGTHCRRKDSLLNQTCRKALPQFYPRSAINPYLCTFSNSN